MGLSISGVQCLMARGHPNRWNTYSDERNQVASLGLRPAAAYLTDALTAIRRLAQATEASGGQIEDQDSPVAWASGKTVPLCGKLLSSIRPTK